MRKVFIDCAALYLIIIAIIIGFVFETFGQAETNIPSDFKQLFPEVFTNPPPAGFSTRLEYLHSFTRAEEIERAYQAGNISEGEAMLAMSMNKFSPSDNSSMDTYGQVVDQYGQPVVGAKVNGFLEFEEKIKGEKYETITDSGGRFNFLGLHGKGLGIVPEKKDYEYNIKNGTKRPQTYLLNSNSPLVFTMWKLRGAEPMVHADTKGLPYWYSFLKPNDDVARINMMTCRDAKYPSEKRIAVEPNYDLEVGLKRDEIIKTNANRVLFCNWSVSIGITNGGLVEIEKNNIYPYEAPVGGYQPMITFNFTTNMAGWTDRLKKGFFFESLNRKVYGRMTIEIDNRGEFYAEIYANPAGSRNLEFDPKIQTR